MEQYLSLLQEIKEKGTWKPPARSGMPGSLSLFGTQRRFNLQEGFPAVTTKPLFWKGVVTELLWFLRGDTNIKYLVDNGVHIWNEDAYNYYCKVVKQNNDPQPPIPFEDFVHVIKETGPELLDRLTAFDYPGYTIGDCGYQYGKLWRAWEKPKALDMAYDNNDFVSDAVYYTARSGKPFVETVDQLADVIKSLKETPIGRRHIISAWNPSTLDQMALHPCHALVQFNCRPVQISDTSVFNKEQQEMFGRGEYDAAYNDYFKDKPRFHLDCQLYQRSADVVLGVPFNIASYALLTHILAKICNMIPGEFIHSFGDVHIYTDHLPAVEEQLTRKPRKLPTLVWENPFDNWEGAFIQFNDYIHAFTHDNFRLEGYDPHPKLKNETKLSTGLK